MPDTTIVRIPTSAHRALKKIAQAEGRTMADVIWTAIEARAAELGIEIEPVGIQVFRDGEKVGFEALGEELRLQLEQGRKLAGELRAMAQGELGRTSIDGVFDLARRGVGATVMQHHETRETLTFTRPLLEIVAGKLEEAVAPKSAS